MPPKKSTATTNKPSPRHTSRLTKQTATKPATRKRKQPIPENDAESPEPPRKKSAPSKRAKEEPILINRAPVLQLWAACVAHFLHPELQWTTCLSIGSAISSITAISKGRSIGTISKPDAQQQKEDKKQGGEGEVDTREIKVMGFSVTIRDDVVIFKGKPKSGREGSLVRRFGEEVNLQRVRETMERALSGSWKGREAELDKMAFSFYERFRPKVAKGQQGWGRKGELFLSRVEEVVCG